MPVVLSRHLVRSMTVSVSVPLLRFSLAIPVMLVRMKEVLGHLLDLDVVEDDERVLGAVGVVGRVGALLLLGLAIEQRGDELAGRGLARAGGPFEARHRPRPREVDEQEAGQPREDQGPVARGAGHVVQDQLHQEAVGLLGVRVAQETDRGHLARAVQDHPVGVPAVLEDVDPVRCDPGDLVVGVVEVEVDGVVRHVRMEPGEVVPHLPALHREVGQHLVEGPSAAGRLHQAGVLVDGRRVEPLAAAVRAVHPEDGVLEEHERLALGRAEEARAVGGEPFEGGLGHAGVVRRPGLLLGLDHHLLDPGAAGAGRRAGAAFLAFLLLPGLRASFLLDGPHLLAQRGQRETGLAVPLLDELQVAVLLQGREPRHFLQDRFQPPVAFVLGDVGRQAGDAELERGLGLPEQPLEVLLRAAGSEVVVDVDLGGGQELPGLLDVRLRAAFEPPGELAGAHRRVEAEAFPQVPPRLLLPLVQREDDEPHLDLVLGEDARGLQGPVEPGLGDLVVLADVDRLHAAELGQEPLPVGGADPHRDRGDRREPVLHQRDAVGHPFGDDDPLGAGQQAVLVE